MRKNLNHFLLFIFFFWNVCFFISVTPQKTYVCTSNNKTFEKGSQSIELSVPEEDLNEIVWQPIENSLDLYFLEEKTIVITNNTSVVEYDVIRKIETISPRREIGVDGTNEPHPENRSI